MSGGLKIESSNGREMTAGICNKRDSMVFLVLDCKGWAVYGNGKFEQDT